MTLAPAAGLTDADVARRVADGKSNAVRERATRSITAIVRANVFTRINAILGVLLLIVLATGSVINGMFGLLIIANSVVGMVQEIRAKQTLDKLAIVGQAKPLVRRQSGTRAVPPGEVVLDDIIELGPGDQVVVDGEVVEEANLEVDESLLTGEADPIAKAVGDVVMSGSFVVAGSGAYRATKVGPDAYATKLAEEASKFTLVKSELRNGINRILQFITYLLVPAGLLTIYTQLFTTRADWREAVLRTVGALVPMVPEGLVLLTSVALAVGVVRLGQRRCLVQELPAIEGLARVDVVCADKTGTLTESGMRVATVDELDPPGNGIADVLASLAAADPRPNASMRAIAETYHEPPGWTVTATAPFKSATKWSGVSFDGQGNWVMGAPDVLLEPASAAAEHAERIGRRGCGCCWSAPVTSQSTTPTRRAASPPSRWWYSNRRFAPTRARRWNILPNKVFRSRCCPVTTRSRSAQWPASSDCAARPWMRANCLPSPRNWPTRWTPTPPSGGCGRTRNAPWCTPCSHTGTPSR